MKIKNLLIVIVLAIACGIFIANYSSSSSYVSFNTAKADPEDEFHVVGRLNKEKPLEYDAIRNPNLFTFYMLDDSNTECRIIYHNPKPQDFERGEKIVIVGKHDGKETFEATEILLKCPSKYNDQGH